MREISFFDDASPKRPTRTIRRTLSQSMELISCLFRPLSSYEIPISGLVINRQFAPRMPSFDKLWNVPNLFERAHRGFLIFIAG